MADIQRNRHAAQDLVGLAQDIGRVLVSKHLVGWKQCAPNGASWVCSCLPLPPSLALAA